LITMIVLFIQLLFLINISSALPVADIKQCSALAPGILQPSFLQPLLSGAVSQIDLDIPKLQRTGRLISKTVFEVPGMGGMLVKYYLRNEMETWYSSVKDKIKVAKESGLTKESLPEIEEMEEGVISNDIMEMSEMVFQRFNMSKEMVGEILEDMRINKPYIQAIEGIERVVDTVGDMLGKEEFWAQINETIICLYDAVADVNAELTDGLTRDQVQSYSDRFTRAMQRIFSSPNLGTTIKTVLTAGVEEVLNIDEEAIFEQIEAIMYKLRDRVVEIPFEKLIMMSQEMYRNTVEMMMIGQAPELEKLMDAVMDILMDDVLLEQWKLNMISVSQNGSEYVGTLLEGGLLSEICEEDQATCMKMGFNAFLEMIEDKAEDLESGDLDDKVEKIRQTVQGINMMSLQIMMLSEIALEKHVIWCMIEPMMINMAENIKLMMEQMMLMTLEDDEGPTDTINYVIDNDLEMMKLVLGGDCPNDFSPVA